MPDALAFNEIDLDRPQGRRPIGGTGTTIFAGGDVWNTSDYNANFQGAKAIQNYEEIRRDPVVSRGLASIDGPITSLTWTIAPGKSVRGEDGEMKPSPMDEKIAKAAQADIIDRHYGVGIQPIQTFADVIRHILSFKDFGVSALNLWWSTGEHGRHVPEFSPRLAVGIFKFTLDPVTRGLAGMWHRAYEPEGDRAVDTFIPAEDLALFSWKQEGDNYFGMAALRPVFKPWDLKRRLELVDAIGLERHACGVDELHLTESVQEGSREEAKLQALIQNVRGHQRGGMLTPPNAKYELHTSGMNGTGVNPSIARLNEEILLALFCEGLLMGGPSGEGNRALGQVKQEDVLILLQGVVNQIRATFGRQVLRRYVLANFGPQTAWPELDTEPLDKMSGKVLAEILKIGKEAGVFNPGPKSEAKFRDIVHFPREEEPYQDPTAPPPQMLRDPSEPEPSVPPPKKAQLSRRRARRVRLAADLDYAEPYFRRAAFAHERHVAFADIQRFLDEEPVRAWHRDVLPVRKLQVEALAKAVAVATDAELPKLAMPPSLDAAMARAVRQALLRSYLKGRVSVLKEAARQRSGQAPEEQIVRLTQYEDEEDELFDAYAPEPTKKQRTWIRDVATGLATLMAAALVQEAIAAGQRAQDQELPKAEIERLVWQALQDTSEGGRVSHARARGQLAERSTQMFTTGRVEQGLAMEDQLTSVFYSARLDSGTCEPCWAMDGAELGDHWAGMVPNPNCAGGANCRCEPVFVFRDREERPAA